MAGVFIYKNKIMESHYSFVIADDSAYLHVRNSVAEDQSNAILWERKNVSLNQIQNSRKTKDNLVKRLNKGEKVDLEKELGKFFD